MTAKVDDVRNTVTSEFKAAGDLVYQLGTTYNELGASEFYKLYDALGANVPKVRKEDAKALYLKVMEANAAGWIESSHDISDGGLAVTVVESAFGGALGVDISLDTLGDLPIHVKLFSESHSRFVVSIRPENQASFEALMGDKASYLGKVSSDKQVKIAQLIDLPTEALLEAWSGRLLL
jgi:phosphoribosylformylglycinamidine synthase